MAEAFGRLPLGTARDLLVRLVGAAEPLYRDQGGQSPRKRRRDVEKLVAVACRAAEGLAVLERVIEAAHDEANVAQARVLRDGLAARFRHAIAGLHQLHAEPADAGPAAAEIARLVATLDEDAEAYAAARRELAARGPHA